MIFEKTLALTKVNAISLAQFGVLLAVAVLAPLAHNQIITGSLVNATLFITAAILGLESAILISLLPSLFALAAGTLPLVLAPLIPFIILSNILLVLVFTYSKKTNLLFGIFSAAVLKFIFLAAVSSWAINLLFSGKLIKTAAIMLSWPQLITALIGGALAYGLLKSGKLISRRESLDV